MLSQPLLLLLYPVLVGAFWFSARPYALLWAFFPCITLLLAAYLLGILAMWPSLALLMTMGACALYLSEQSLWCRRGWLLYGVIVPLVLLISFRVFPGVSNPMLLDGTVLSALSPPLILYQNWDKAILAILLLIVVSRMTRANGSCWRGLWLLPVAIVTIFSLGLSMGHIAVDIKWPEWPVLLGWGLSNLLITCVLEEAFFRGILQRGLMNYWQHYRYGSVAALIVVALLFGLVHFSGGWLFVVLATVAGLFYGAIYWLSGNLWLAVLLHFMVNLVHFLGFSYPSIW